MKEARSEPLWLLIKDDDKGIVSLTRAGVPYFTTSASEWSRILANPRIISRKVTPDVKPEATPEAVDSDCPLGHA